MSKYFSFFFLLFSQFTSTIFSPSVHRLGSWSGRSQHSREAAAPRHRPGPSTSQRCPSTLREDTRKMMRFKNHALATVAHNPENLAHDSDFPSKHKLSHNPAFFETRAHISPSPLGESIQPVTRQRLVKSSWFLPWGNLAQTIPSVARSFRTGSLLHSHLPKKISILPFVTLSHFRTWIQKCLTQ